MPPKPGKFRFCVYSYCALPYGGDTYRNCEHDCLYCYEIQANNQHLRDRVLHPLDHRTLFNSLYDEREISEFAIRRGVPVRIGVVSDPFPSLEQQARSTFRLSKLLQRGGFQVQYTTKAPQNIDAEQIAVMRAMDKAMVRVSFSTLDDARARELEPGAASPTQRLAAMRRLSNVGIEVGARLAPFLHTEDYDYPAFAEAGCTNLTVELFRFSLLWRHSTDPHLWEVFSGEEAPLGDVTDKQGLLRQWVEAKEHEFFAPMQTLSAHEYHASSNLWVNADIYKLRELWERARQDTHTAGMHFGICSFGCGIHNVDLNDEPCGCLTSGWRYDPGALVPAWHVNEWADYMIPTLHGYHYDVALERFIVANSEYLRPIAWDDDPTLYRAAILEAEELAEEIGSTRATG